MRAFPRGCARKHWFRRRSVSGFADSDEGAGDEQKEEAAGEATRQGREAPAHDTEDDDGFAAETVGKETEGDAADGENDEKPSLQGAELRVGDAKIGAQHGNDG